MYMYIERERERERERGGGGGGGGQVGGLVGYLDGIRATDSYVFSSAR